MRFTKLQVGVGILVLIIIAGLIGVIASRRGNGTIRVERRDFVQTVEVSGKTKAAYSADLAFDRSGVVSQVWVDVGSVVSPGQPLISLDTRELQAKLIESEANLQVQLIKLAELERGERREEVEIKKFELEKSQQDLANLYLASPDDLFEAYIKAENAVKKLTDALFTNDNSFSPKLTFSTSDFQLETEVINYRIIAGDNLEKLDAELQSIDASSSKDEIDRALQVTKNYLEDIKKFLNLSTSAVIKSVSLSDSTKASYLADLNTARTDVGSASSGVNDRIQSIASQIAVVSKIKSELDLKLAGSTLEELQKQEAAVLQAKASVAVIEAQLDKSIIYAPIGGTVTEKEVEEGELATAGLAVLSIASTGSLEIEADVPEINIGNIEVMDPVQITFDALPESEFYGTITRVNPAETLVDGVVNYKIKVSIESEDPRLKPGLTANLDIETLRKPKSLLLPVFALISRDGKYFAVKKTPNGSAEVEVEVGLKDNSGNIEILNGLNEGDEVLDHRASAS